jgi:hypothetical protein
MPAWTLSWVAELGKQVHCPAPILLRLAARVDASLKAKGEPSA